jgi:hypothetical protein
MSAYEVPRNLLEVARTEAGVAHAQACRDLVEVRLNGLTDETPFTDAVKDAAARCAALYS